MLNKEWVQKLKEGDEVYISQSYGYPPIHGNVCRLTPTQIVIKTNKYDSKFHRKDGWSIGGGSWHRQFLIMPSDEVREKIEVSDLQSKAKELRNKLATPNTKVALIKFIKYLSELIKDEKLIKEKES